MISFIGTYDCKADAKGRIMIPVTLKNQMAPILNEGFVIKRSVFQPCLELYPLSEWNQLMQRMNRKNRFKKKNNDFIRRFTQRFADLAERVEQTPTDSVIRVTWDDHLQGYVNSLAAYFNSPAAPGRPLLELKFEELLLNIFTRPHHRELAGFLAGLNDTRATGLRQVMEANYAFALKLEDFAELCGQSLSSFKRMFREVYEMAPGKWLSEKRLDRAAQLLQVTDKQVNEVAYDVGFEEPSSFIRAFKQRFGTTPSNYRTASH